MASQFYSRYIPPSTHPAVTIEHSRPSKKRKRIQATDVDLPEPSRGSESVPEKTNDNAAAFQPFSPVTSSPNGERSVDEGQDLPLRNRHQAILSKYEKAKKNLAEKEHKLEGFEDEPMTGHNDQLETDFYGLEPLPQPAQVEEIYKVSLSSALPEWLRSARLVSSDSTIPFNSLPLDRKTVSCLQERGYENALAIQSAVLTMLLPGPEHYSGDICISAATGSGKTLAYTLPVVESVREKPMTRLRGLIVVPTRELVNQVKETLDLCSGGNGLAIGTAVGSKTVKDEKALLVEKGQRYDPEAYRAEQEKEIDEDEELMNWDIEERFGPKDEFELLYNHVVEYTSKVDILICTPGRLVEHMQSTTGFTLKDVQWLVIDEADRLLDESFQQWVDTVMPALEYLPPLDPIQERLSNTFHLLRRREVRKIVLSATMTRDISKLIALKLRRPRLVVLEGQSPKIPQNVDNAQALESTERIELPPTLMEVGIKVTELNEKPLYLLQLLESELGTRSQMAGVKQPEPPDSSDDEHKTPEDSAASSESDQDMTSSKETSLVPKKSARPTTHGTLIFTKTNEHATRLARLLSLLRPSCSAKMATLTKSTTSSSGQKALSAFRKRKLSILIASDRASRGLDIPDLAHVINYDMPPSLTSYVHRVGRTARAGKEGKAATLIADNEARWFWNEIARSERVGRGKGKKVQRVNMVLEVGEEERERYQEALSTLGEETRGNRE